MKTNRPKEKQERRCPEEHKGENNDLYSISILVKS